MVVVMVLILMMLMVIHGDAVGIHGDGVGDGDDHDDGGDDGGGDGAGDSWWFMVMVVPTHRCCVPVHKFLGAKHSLVRFGGNVWYVARIIRDFVTDARMLPSKLPDPPGQDIF